MTIDHPRSCQLPQLRSLWKAAFGDTDDFLDQFFSTAYHPQRCRCITLDGTVAAALYWFDVTCREEKMAYLYAVATHPNARGQGLCRRLMEDVRNLLSDRGYAAILLVPQEEPLVGMYAKMGYRPATGVAAFYASPAAALPLKKISAAEYGALRRALLPPGGVLQEAENLTFLATQAEFYAGADFVAAVTADGDHLHCHELLGSRSAAAGIVAALNCRSGFFRVPGEEIPFAMIQKLKNNCPDPQYFGLAFD